MSSLVTISLLLEAEDRHGDETLTEDGTVIGCVVGPRTSVEDENGRAQTITGLVLLPPAGSNIKAHHQVRFVDGPYADGSRWRVVGDPGRWRSPWSAWSPGDEIQLERVRG